jgi:hypothetical protein
MNTKRRGSGLGARVSVQPTSAVAAGLEAALGGSSPEPEPAKGEVVAINVRLPKELHRKLRRIAFDEETSITALLIEAAERMLAARED